MYVADSLLGLLAVSKAGEVTVVANKYHNLTISADDVKVASNGDIYFTHCTSIAKEGDRDIGAISIVSIVASEQSGKVFKYDASTKQLQVIIENMTFANGIELSDDGSFLLVAETGRYQIWRYWIKGPKAGTSEIFMHNFPGFPDGVRRGSTGFWIAGFGYRKKMLDAIHPYPMAKKLLLAIPHFLQPKPDLETFVMHVDQDGKILERYDSDGKIVPSITSVWESAGKLYLGTLREKHVSVFDRGTEGS
eukprot:TRINITY_DN4056_c0_g1_i1.p1 TRINITY_DN4056_c0_g1~~TRINITY_DN4056_c0_g1_i1.p1  ORF type:complete len:249 (-),score=88.30 TRINITY_DN4056_c0_g1_i1:70-816(-)